jgi:sugar (pentulose or hexulose) kinase
MGEKNLLLAIDNGTQSVKALVFDLAGNLVAKEKRDFEPYFSKEPGWAEQDPEIFWDNLCAACQALWTKHGIDQNRIAGVAVTTQRGTVVCVDENGNPLRPAILWLDQRKTYNLAPIKQPWGALLAVSGLSGILNYLRTQAESVWIANHQKQIWENTHKFLLLSGFLNYRLTGEFADSVGCQVGYLPFDYKKLSWLPSWDFRWELLCLSPEKLPKLVEQGLVIGAITRQAAELTGIVEGTPVLAGAADKACEVLGSGARLGHVGCISYGTTATINVNSEKYVTAFPLMPAYPSAITGNHNVEVQIFRGFWMVSWFKEEFGYDKRMEALEKGVEAEVLFEELVKKVPAGSMGLMLQPYWTPGVKHPGPEGKGAIIGFGDVHTRGHVYRAILEGLAYALREGGERIEKRSKNRISTLVVSGGGSQSDCAMQITADVFGLPASRPHLYETSGLGAAMILAKGLNLHPDWDSTMSAMTRKGTTFEPSDENHRLYSQLYQEVYLKLYDRMKPLYQKIREITGYPD